MPKYLFTIVEDADTYLQGTESPSHAEVAAMHGDFAGAVVAGGGEVLGGEALQPISTATFLRGTRTDQVAVVDNPAPDLKEVLGGYYLVRAADDEHALAFAKVCPAPAGYVEVRLVWEFDA